MTITTKNIGNGFSRDAIKKAVSEEKLTPAKKVELNELAKQVAEQFDADSISPSLVSGFLRIFEFLLVMAIGLAVFLGGETAGRLVSWHGFAASAGCGLATVAFIQGIDGYPITTLRRITTSFIKAATGLTMAMLLVACALFFVTGLEDKTAYTLANWFGMTLASILVLRVGLGMWVSRLMNDGRLERRAVIVGGGNGAAELIHSMEANSNSDIRICGIFDDRSGDRSPEIVAGYPKLGTVPELVEFARLAKINMLIVSIPLTAQQRVLQLLKRLWVLPVDIRLSAHTNKLAFRQRSYTYEGGVPFLDVFERPIADWDYVMKRGFDIVVASMALVLLSPLMLLTAIAVKLDSKGPVFFKQKREGFNNEEIEIFKFRSLHTDQGDRSGINVVTKNDSRVTRVGRLIRKSSIDELPQLFNVILGSLSLVGPRPHVANAQTGNKLWNDVVDSYFARHKVKPGVTGWAQVNGWRGEVDTEEKIHGRVDYDLYYIENWSILFDIYILAITPFKLLNTENAY